MDLLELSSDKVSNENDGEIEYAYNASMAPEFKAFSFENKVGDIDVVGTSFGFHIIEILEQKSYNKALKVATLAREIEPSDQTLQDVFNKVSKFEIAAKDADFNALAEENELTVKPVTFKELDENIPGLGSQRPVVRWAFEDDTEVGDYKRIVKETINTYLNVYEHSVVPEAKFCFESATKLFKEMKELHDLGQIN